MQLDSTCRQLLHGEDAIWTDRDMCMKSGNRQTGYVPSAERIMDKRALSLIISNCCNNTLLAHMCPSTFVSRPLFSWRMGRSRLPDSAAAMALDQAFA